MNHIIEAQIRYRTPAEGGRQSGVASGYRGQFHYAGNDHDGFQYFPDYAPLEFVPLGESVRAFIEFGSGRWREWHAERIHEGMRFEVREGCKVVGDGVVTRLSVSQSEWLACYERPRHF